jgi:hypothetical protein
MDRTYRSRTFHPTARSHPSDGIGVSILLDFGEGGMKRPDVISWWQEAKHTLKRPGQKDQTFTITAVPNMVRPAQAPSSKLTSSTGPLAPLLIRMPLYGQPSTSNPIPKSLALSSISEILGMSLLSIP